MSPHGAYPFSGNVAPFKAETGQHQGLLTQAPALSGVGSLTDTPRASFSILTIHQEMGNTKPDILNVLLKRLVS